MKNTQNLVWRYLTLHRKITGESLSYLKLLQYSRYREQAHQQALQTGDAQLIALSEQAQAWLKSRPGAVSSQTSVTRADAARDKPAPSARRGGNPKMPGGESPDVASEAPGIAVPHDGGPRRMLGAASLLGAGLLVAVAGAMIGGVSLTGDADAGFTQRAEKTMLPTTAERPIQLVSEPIAQSQTWRADTVYKLTAPVFVEAGASLTIEAGTRIIGESGSALIVTKDAKLYARGSRTAPIVFTSAKAPGERARGDWGGLVLLGNAPINQGSARIEGVDEQDPRGMFGGDQVGDSCGLLEFVRVEFAGFEVFTDNELNGLTLGGCGHKTIVRNVQVHRSLDDGVEVFGGDVDFKNIVVTGARDDGFDWDMGWRGRVQFLVVQQHADVGDNAFEADNWKKDHDASPRSAPTFYNVTLVGGLNAQKAQRAMTLRRGTAGSFHNVVITGFDKEAIDVRDPRTAALATSGELTLDHSLFYEIGADGHSYFSPEPPGDADDDKGFDENAFFRRSELANRFDQPPLLSEAAFNVSKPDFTPLPMSPATEGAALPPEDEFWDQGATYVGAIKPGASRSWIVGWTDFPKT